MPRISKEKPVEETLSDDEADQMESVAPAPVVKPVKQKKPRTQAQQESFQKALAVLKEKREMKMKDEKERLAKASAEERARIEKEKYEKARNHKKRLPPAPSYVTMSDLDKFKTDLLNAIPKYTPPEPQSVKPEPVKVEVKPEPVKVAPPKESKPKTLTGHELIDKLFFT
jgi:hypothetical protein